MRPRRGMNIGGRGIGRPRSGRGGFMGGPRGGMAGYTAGLEDVDYRLFRFFDYTAEPGHVYQYRVRLVLSDPNLDVEPQFLTKSAADRISKEDPKLRPYRLSEWSEPSSPVAVPHGGRLIAGPAEATSSQRFDDEPKVNVVAMRFDAAEGASAAAELKELVRGSVANVTKKLEILELRRNVLREMEDYHLNTDTTILDIRGGQKLAGGGKNELTAPAEILVMSQTGQLSVQSELGDEEAYQQFQDIFEAPLDGDEEVGPGRRPNEPGRKRGRGGPSVYGE